MVGAKKFRPSCGWFLPRFQEVLVDGFVDVASLHRQAGLAGIHECAPDGGAGGHVHIGIFQHDHGILAPELQYYREQPRRCDLRDFLSSGYAAGKDQLVDRGLQQG
jgi:hypothetical protein